MVNKDGYLDFDDILKESKTLFRFVSLTDDIKLNRLKIDSIKNGQLFPILSLLYPYLDYKNNDFHKDHLHADDLYDSLPEAIKSSHPYKEYNSIVNLQMLDKNENESKGKKSLKDWVDSSCPNSDDRIRFLNSHIIPDVDLSLNNIDNFLKERKKLLKQKLKAILD